MATGPEGFRVVTVKTEGFAEIREALLELPKATSANVVRRALMKAGQPVVNDAKALAPKRHRDLERSIDIQPAQPSKMTKRGKSAYDKQNEVEVIIDAGPNPQSVTQEFGTVHHGPQSYMRPAWESNRHGVLTSIKQQLWEEIEKAARRLAKKTARLAAKSVSR